MLSTLIPAGQPARLCLVFGDTQADEFMHRADVFEPFKRLITLSHSGDPIHYFEIRADKDQEVSTILDKVTAEMDKTGKQFWVVAWVTGYPELTRVRPGCKVISSGTNWVLLRDLLKQIGAPESLLVD